MVINSLDKDHKFIVINNKINKYKQELLFLQMKEAIK